MATYSAFLSLINGVARTVNLSANTLSVGALEIAGTSLSQAGVFAFFTGIIPGTATSVSITADWSGTAGNSVALVFTGSNTIAQEIAAWNLANPTNAVTLTSGDGTQIPTAQTVDLSGGVNSGSSAIADTATYENFTPTSPTVAGALAGIDIALAQAGSGTQKVDKFTLNSTNISNGFVTLSGTPTVPGDTILLIENAGNMFYGNDFTVTGDQLSWGGLLLAGILSVGDNLTVTYNV